MNGLALNSIARGLVVLFQLINVKLYTEYLDAAQLGIYFFFLSISYSANALLFVPVDYFQQANLLRLKKAPCGLQPLLTLNKKLGIYYLLCSLILVLFVGVIWPNHFLNVTLMTLFAYALYIVQALRNTLNNLEFRDFVSISFIQEAISKVGLLYIVGQYFRADATSLLMTWLGALLLTGLYLARKVTLAKLFAGAGAGAGAAHEVNGMEVIRFSYPFAIGAVCNWLQLQGYRMVLVPLGFAAEVGIFATLSSLGSAAIGAVSLIYSQQFTPRIYKSNGKYTIRYLQGAILVLVAVGFIIGVVGEQMIRVLTRPEFSEYWGLMLYGVFSDGAVLMIGALMIHISLSGDTKKILWPAFFGLIGMVGCFTALYLNGGISVVTIGIPLLVSQWIIVACIFSVFRKL